jgi:hypothetical protein
MAAPHDGGDPMRVLDALRYRASTAPLVSGTTDEQARAMREYQRDQIARAIIATKDEIPRSELDFQALGGRVIEREQEWIARNVAGGTRSFELERIDQAIRVVKTVADREPRSWRRWS